MPRTIPSSGRGTMFRETQYFRQIWMIALVLGISAILSWGVVQQVVLGAPWGDNPASDGFMVLMFVLFGLLLPLFMFVVHLETEVTTTSLNFRFFPLHLKPRRIPLEDIAEHRAITYSPLKEFGGWGIRYGKLGTAYNVRGNEGVLIRTTAGRQILIGSRRAVELNAALGSMTRRTK
ncbi:MAG: hypothetical protein ISF22_09950 [Methanomassiliicoccus sp.]|nr:hypothetical protein [Methanomassiliicoccus sp.]